MVDSARVACGLAAVLIRGGREGREGRRDGVSETRET